MQAGTDCAVSFKTLLEHVHSIVLKPTYEKKQKLLALSREVASTVADLVHCGEALKGPDWVNPEDPTVMAESELLKAAAQIEAAAKKLDELQPRSVVGSYYYDFNYDFISLTCFILNTLHPEGGR